MSQDKDEIVKMAREALLNEFGVAWQIEALERFATLCRADLVAETDQLRAEVERVRRETVEECVALRAEVEAFDKAEDSWMRKAIELEAEVAKLRGLVAERSAEHLAAHITYDKGYQEGRLDAEAALKPVAEIGVSVFTWLGDRPPAGTTLYRIEQP